MKNPLITLSIILLTSTAYSQENGKSLTDAQKDALKKNHNSSLSFTTKNSTSKNNLNFTSSSEQNENDVKTTVVQYYYGKEDSVYRKFEYK